MYELFVCVYGVKHVHMNFDMCVTLIFDTYVGYHKLDDAYYAI